jgi:hypothetical protein
MLIIFFDIMKVVHKEFVLAGQTVNSKYYSDISLRLPENVRRLGNELQRQKNWPFHHDNAPSHISFFNREFFTKSNMTLVLHTPYFSLFPRLKIKLKGRHFDTVELIEAESQTVLNTATEHELKDAFKKWQKRWERRIRAEGDYFEGDGGQ